MKQFFLSILVITIGWNSAVAGDRAEKRPITIDDLWKIKRIGAPSVSPDGAWAAVEVTTYGKEEGTSNVWLLGTDGKKQKQLTSFTGKNSGPKWSPDGQWIAFLSKSGMDEAAQIYLIAPEGGGARRLTHMPMAPSGIKWSADSKTIYCVAWSWPDTPDDAAYRKKDKELKESKVKALVIDDFIYRYWDKWLADGKKPMVFAVNVETGKHTNMLAGTGMHLPLFEPSASSYDVAPDGKELCFVASSAKGNDINLDLFTLSLDAKGEPKNITPDNEASDTNPVYSPDGKHLAYLRQALKFAPECQKLMVVDRAEGKSRCLTADLDRSCANPRWLPDGKRLVFEADDAGYRNIYFVSIDGKGTKLFPSGYSERSIDFAAKDRLAVFIRSSFNMPPTVFAHKPGDKEATQISHFNDALCGKWKLGKVEEVTFKGADDDKVHLWVVYPPDFDAKKKWPLVQVVHGGPHMGIMTDFSFRWNLQLWAARGYVIGCVNFHGSSGFGQKFADSITGDFAAKPMLDIMKATDWFEKQPWIDKERIATAGASYGGYMMAWLNGHTDRFKAMVCHAGVYNFHGQMASDVVRGRERSLGAFPWNDMAKVDRQSAQRYCANFKTPTLVLHGEKDFRVPLTHGLEYFNTLKLKGIPARLVYFPDENHWILKQGNSRLWHREVFAWLERYIGRGPTEK